VRSLFLAIAGAGACSCPEPAIDARPTAWSEAEQMPGPRLEPGVTALGDRVVVLGGFDQSETQGLGITTDVIEFDMFAAPTQRWRALRSAPVAWTHANLAAASATLYLLGGAEGTDFVARGEAYALDTGADNPQWRAIAPMPPGMERDAAGIVVAPPNIILIGGATTTDALASVIKYDYSTNTWAELPSLPAKRSHPAVMRTPDGTLIAAGGLETLASSSAKADVWSLAPNGTQWVARAPMPSARGGCAYGVVLEQLICAGGEVGAAALDTTLRYDAVSDVWSELDEMPASRAGTQGAVVGGRLFVPGGAAQLRFEPTNTLFAFAFLESLDQ
jgi:N-acetylneuraminic acid mutarotase